MRGAIHAAGSWNPGTLRVVQMALATARHSAPQGWRASHHRLAGGEGEGLNDRWRICFVWTQAGKRDCHRPSREVASVASSPSRNASAIRRTRPAASTVSTSKRTRQRQFGMLCQDDVRGGQQPRALPGRYGGRGVGQVRPCLHFDNRQDAVALCQQIDLTRGGAQPLVQHHPAVAPEGRAGGGFCRHASRLGAPPDPGEGSWRERATGVLNA